MKEFGARFDRDACSAADAHMLDQIQQDWRLEQFKKHWVPVRQTVKAPILGVRIHEELIELPFMF
jgi:hypothetical protein